MTTFFEYLIFDDYDNFCIVKADNMSPVLERAFNVSQMWGNKVYIKLPKEFKEKIICELDAS